MPTVKLEISKRMKAQIAATAKQRGVTRSELVRTAIGAFLREQPQSAYDRIRDLIEDLPDTPALSRDRSSNPQKYMGGFGLPGPRLREWVGRVEKERARRARARTGR